MRPSKRSSLACLTKKRLILLARTFELDVVQSEPKDAFVDALDHASVSFVELLDELTRAELELICREHELTKSGTKAELVARILADAPAPAPAPAQAPLLADTPTPTRSRTREPTPTPATMASLLDALDRERLLDLGRVFGAGLRDARQSRSELARQLAPLLGDGRLPDVLAELGRDELRAICRAHGLADVQHLARRALIDRLVESAGITTRTPARPLTSHEGVPQPGAVLAARGRQWLVESVELGEHRESPLLRLACLDDDAPGRALELLWDLELGARVIEPESGGLGQPEQLDPPAHFGAYLHALRWSAASAADATRFQAPFRAGIKLMAHQLTPLMKALELPRANLFIADDVGLGKTIEAGLVLQELILRQQAAFVLIVCPASVTLQWRDEMMRRFGLRFEVMSRQFIAERRRERGFGINPWATHNRFIVSHPLIRRTEYRDTLLAHLGHRAEKGLLILDEAHVAAPASATKYALDSDTTAAIRDLAPKFDNRLFLSATPHNGHSNSFSALLEILDPIRFTRGVPVSTAESLAPIMVRRLKRDLRQLGVDHYPRRILTRIVLDHGEGGWAATSERYDPEANRREPAQPLAAALGGEAHELALAEQLARYTELCAPATPRGRLVFINLQKRLLSSPEAFARTLEVHALGLASSGGAPKVRAAPRQVEVRGVELVSDVEAYGDSDDALEAEQADALRTSSAALASPTQEAAALLASMRTIAERARRLPDAKTRALLAWLRAHLCADKTWTDRRVIIFTEYGDTKRYLLELLGEAFSSSERADQRIMVMHGGMPDDARDEVQRAFNSPPEQHPVRILIATDAAREGVNLQAHCADLFHFDVPWNPARMEQRNGRIDRTLQPADEVRCHYFVLAARREDQVLDTLVRKIDTVQRELGSVGAVLLDEMDSLLAAGIDEHSARKLDALGADARRAVAERELEAHRKQLDTLQAEVHRAGMLLDKSRKHMQVEPAALRGVVEIGLRMAGAGPLQPGPTLGAALGKTMSGTRESFVLPPLDRSWQPTLDSLRAPRGRDESLWDFRARPPKPVTFEALEQLGEAAEQLHLAHPFVKRILDRFLAQGYGAHDLTRVSAVVVPGESVARVLAYARLTLFGPHAARLHDELIVCVAPWPNQPAELTPYKDPATAAKAREACERALADADARMPTRRPHQQILDHAPALFAAAWPHLREQADSLAVDARTGLARRARKESDELRELISQRRVQITKAQLELRQVTLAELGDKAQRRQVELDLGHLVRRLAQLDDELVDEPKAIEALYEVHMTRLVPVGLVVAWPEAMT
jgi:superfamily II DNA or RNA helicase